MGTPLERFRKISLIEGLSFILLLGIAMPLKYLLDMPMAVTIVGWAHGILFMAYFIFLIHVMVVERWSLWKGFLACLASVIPFGPFFFDKKYLVNNAA